LAITLTLLEKEYKMTKFEIDGLDIVLFDVARTQYKQDPLIKARNKVLKLFDKYNKADELEFDVNGQTLLGVPYGNTFLKHNGQFIGINVTNADGDQYEAAVLKLRAAIVAGKFDSFIQPMLDQYKARYAKRTTKLANKKQLKQAA
jgi:hypothetical protein